MSVPTFDTLAEHLAQELAKNGPKGEEKKEATVLTRRAELKQKMDARLGRAKFARMGSTGQRLFLVKEAKKMGIEPEQLTNLIKVAEGAMTAGGKK